MEQNIQSENQAVIDAVERLCDTESLELVPMQKGVPKLIALPKGKVLVNLVEYFDQLRDRPERRSGKANLKTLGSFIDHTKRFQDEDSAIFADPSETAPKLVSVLDYHHEGAQSLPRFGHHRGVYEFPLSTEWLAWRASNNKPFGQAEFAAFLEERIADVSDPAGAGESVREFATLLGTSLASPSRLMDLSRGLTVHVGGKAVSAVNLSSGEGQITFTEEHKDSTGGKLSVPGAFVLAIPVFRGGALYQVPARLRYRVNGGVISWSYVLYRTERVFQHAFDEAALKAGTDTGLPVFYGTPE